jgi:hypothetical protein
MPIAIPQKFQSGLETLGLLRINPADAQELIAMEQHTPELRERRKITLGASEVPMAVGLSRYGNGPAWLRKKFDIDAAPSIPRGFEKKRAAAAAYQEEQASDQWPRAPPGCYLHQGVHVH